MKHHAIAALFDQMADLLEFRGDNVFRIRAYRKAAQNLEALTQDLEQLSRENRLTEIPGIGKELAEKIREYLAHGRIREIDLEARSLPAGVLAMLQIPGIGPKTLQALYKRLRITSIDQLEAAARTHRLRTLPGFQDTKERNILKGIAILRTGQARMHLGVAVPLARHIISILQKHPAVARIEAAGSLRRMKETIGDLDILVATSNPSAVMQAFTRAPFCTRILATGSTKSSVLTADNIQVDLRAVPPKSFGAALVYFTGSKEHNVKLREMAIRKGLKINEYGVFRSRTGKWVGGREERDVYAALGLPWIPPEIREDAGEIQAAAAGRLPRLVELKDIKGDFHIHTSWSDGSNTLEEMAQAGQARGYQYLAICDHSQSLKVAGGMTERELKTQMTKIRALNAHARNFQLLMGAEVDILNQGRMDYPNELLRQLDFVIGSIHTGFKQDRATLTHRVVTAMRNPYVTMIAHPTGRLLGQREPYALDLEAVFEAASRTRTAMEINAYPKRLDLNDAAARQAKARGVQLAISTDTHARDQLEHIALGVGMARRAWLGPQDLLNCLSREQLLTWVQRKRQRARA